MPTSKPAYDSASRRNRRIDWVLGIALGLVLGIALVAAFVFLGSESAVDAPRISGVDTGKPTQQAPKARQ